MKKFIFVILVMLFATLGANATQVVTYNAAGAPITVQNGGGPAIPAKIYYDNYYNRVPVRNTYRNRPGGMRPQGGMYYRGGMQPRTSIQPRGSMRPLTGMRPLPPMSYRTGH